MRKLKKKLKKPKKLWDRKRIDEEKILLRDYGLRRKREIWKAESVLRKYRRRARDLAASKDKIQEKILLDKVHNTGLIKKDANIDDVLSLSVNDILERRLQTIVLRKGMTTTPKQARQLIVHGHISVDEKRTNYPSFMVSHKLEKKISFSKGVPVSSKKGV